MHARAELTENSACGELDFMSPFAWFLDQCYRHIGPGDQRSGHSNIESTWKLAGARERRTDVHVPSFDPRLDHPERDFVEATNGRSGQCIDSGQCAGGDVQACTGMLANSLESRS